MGGPPREWRLRDEFDTTPITAAGMWSQAKGFFTTAPGEYSITPADRIRTVMQDTLWPVVKAMRAAAKMQGKATEGQRGTTPAAILDPEQDPELLLRLYGGFNDTMGQIMEHGPLDLNGKPRLEGGATWLVGSLDATSKATMKRDLRLAYGLMVSERGLDEAARVDRELAIEVEELTVRYESSGEPDFVSEGLAEALDDAIRRAKEAAALRKDRLTGAGAGLLSDTDVAQRALAEWDNVDQATKDRVEEFARRYRAWADATLRHYVDSGMISEARYTAIKKANPRYIDLHRVFDDESTTQVLKAFGGSTREIDRPLVSLMVGTEQMYRKASRNAVMRTFRDLLVSGRKMYDGPVKQLEQIGTKVEAADKDTTPIRVKNEKTGDVEVEHWRLAPDIVAALEAWGSSHDDSLLQRLLQVPARVLRWGVTRSPSFLVRNVIRDAQHRAVISTNGSKPWGVFSLPDKAELAAYRAAGGGQAGHYLRDKVNYHRELTKRMKELQADKSTVLGFLGKLPGAYDAAARWSEEGGRLDEYRKAKAKAKGMGYTEHQAELYAAYHARSLMDFAIAGTFVREVTKYIPFVNAAVQGLTKTGTEALRNPIGFGVRWAAYVLTPSLAFYALAAARGPEEEERYRQLPAWRRDLFYNARIPGTDTWLSIPKPFELGVLASGVERGIDRARGDKKAFEGYGGTLARSLLPIDDANMVPLGLKQAVEVATNHDLYRGSWIIPPWEAGKNLELRDQSRASRLGKVVGHLVGADARFVDHWIRGSLGGLGGLGSNTIDSAANLLVDKPDTRGLGWKDTGLAARESAYAQRDVEWTLKEAVKRGEDRSKAITGLRDLLKLATKALTSAERDKWRRLSLLRAKDLRKAWEKP